MPLAIEEGRIVDARREAVEAAVAEFGSSAWSKRAAAAALQLEGIHADWWGRFNAQPDAYARDLARLNALAGWSGDYAAVREVERAGRRYLAPPKFFGGSAAALSEDFVLAVSLNHATPETDGYVAELADFQVQGSCLIAHRDYFRQAYAYRRFFASRAKVLTGYTEARRLEVPQDWRLVNERFSLYLERYPTLSRKCTGAAACHEELEAESFVMALNALAHDVVLRLLRPRAVLLAGRATWALVPAAAPADSSERIRPDQRRACPATVDRLALAPGAAPSTVVRCNFLRTVHGPNSDDELRRLGSLLAE